MYYTRGKLQYESAVLRCLGKRCPGRNKRPSSRAFTRTAKISAQTCTPTPSPLTPHPSRFHHHIVLLSVFIPFPLDNGHVKGPWGLQKRVGRARCCRAQKSSCDGQRRGTLSFFSKYVMPLRRREIFLTLSWLTDSLLLGLSIACYCLASIVMTVVNKVSVNTATTTM